MKRKGFTLIELLAVIVILAIIALISIPMVLNTIDKAKEGAAKSSAYSYVSATETRLATYMLRNNGTSYSKGLHTVAKLKSDLKVELKGDAPSEGKVCIGEKGTIEKASLKINGYVINYDGKDATATDLEEVEDITCDTQSGVVYKCKRASTLHTEECTQPGTSYYCGASGYKTSGSKGTTTITYGNLGTSGTLTSGDAFDCDVNGDKKFDEVTERFYYVSDLYNTTTKAFDSDYAVLVYYNNTAAGVANNSSASLKAYDSSYENWHGPVNAITHLPTIQQWSNISLKSTIRAMINEKGGNSNSSGKPLTTAFNYTKKVNGEGVPLAARLLTYQEVAKACGGDGNPTSRGELDGCNYLLENTKYSSSTPGTYGYWLETPYEVGKFYAWFVYGYDRFLEITEVRETRYYGVRPAIEVLKSDILY